jgi:hypothetical protein
MIILGGMAEKRCNEELPPFCLPGPPRKIRRLTFCAREDGETHSGGHADSRIRVAQGVGSGVEIKREEAHYL